jgi:hypothetical protein
MALRQHPSSENRAKYQNLLTSSFRCACSLAHIGVTQFAFPSGNRACMQRAFAGNPCGRCIRRW